MDVLTHKHDKKKVVIRPLPSQSVSSATSRAHALNLTINAWTNTLDRDDCELQTHDDNKYVPCMEIKFEASAVGKQISDTILHEKDMDPKRFESRFQQYSEPNLCEILFVIENVVRDVETDNIGNEWNSWLVVRAYANDSCTVPDTLIDLCFAFYVVIEETMRKIDWTLSWLPDGEDYDEATSNSSIVRGRKCLLALKERLFWCQAW